MMIVKRHALALLWFAVVWVSLGVLFEAIPLPASLTGAFSSRNEAEQAQNIAMLWINSFLSIQALIAYAVGAYTLRRNALVPGLLVYVLMALPAIWILHSIALPAQPSITFADVIAGNLSGWISSFVACIAGLLIGEHLAKYRYDTRAYAS
ncbi:MAG: hypothetical protein AAF004_02715 [Pseudomonadota bacterium]